MSIQNISDLNKKWWYRLIKVAFMLLTIACSILIFFIVYDSKKPYIKNEYKITCVSEDSNKIAFSAGDMGLYIHDDQGIVIPDYTRAQINKICGIEESVAKQYDENALDALLKLGKYKNASDEESKKFIERYRIFEIDKYSAIKGGYISRLGYLSLSLLIILLIVEIIRRIFYYIVLGRFFPSK